MIEVKFDKAMPKYLRGIVENKVKQRKNFSEFGLAYYVLFSEKIDDHMEEHNTCNYRTVIFVMQDIYFTGEGEKR